MICVRVLIVPLLLARPVFAASVAMLTSSSGSIGADYIEARNRTVVLHANAVDYDDIIRLFTHRHTSTLFKRQAAAFRQIAREKKDGLAMSDIQPVVRVVQLGLERLAG